MSLFSLLVSSYTFWIVLGLLLILAEAMTPGFVLMFFGLSAITVSGLVALFPSKDSAWPLWPALVFVALSVVYIAALRKFFKRVFMGREETAQEAFDNFTGQSATVTVAIAPRIVGKVEFHGTQWEAASEEECPVGTRVTIVRKESLTLVVKPFN